MSIDFDYQDDYDANVWPKEDCECGHRRYQHADTGRGRCTQSLNTRGVPAMCNCPAFSDPEPYFDGM